MTASNAQYTDNSGVAGYQYDPSQGNETPQLQNPGTADINAAAGNGNYNITGGSNPFGALGNAANTAGSALNIYNGLQRGGISGYGGAALSAASLANKFGGANIPGLGPASEVLGLYNGLKQGGVQGYTSAALNAAGLYGAAANAGLLGSGAAAGAGAGAGAAAASLAGPLALVGAFYAAGGMGSSGYSNSDVEKMISTLQKGPGPAEGQPGYDYQRSMAYNQAMWGINQQQLNGDAYSGYGATHRNALMDQFLAANPQFRITIGNTTATPGGRNGGRGTYQR